MGFFAPRPLADQHEIAQNWMWINPVLGAIGLLVALRHSAGNKNPAHFLALALGAFTSMFMFELTGYDLHGTHFAALNYYNSKIAPITGIHFTDVTLSITCVSGLMMAFAASILYYKRGNILPVAWGYGVLAWGTFGSHIWFFLNDMMETGDLEKSYNPGLFSACLLFPVAVWFLQYVAGKYGALAAVSALMYGGPVHGFLVMAPLKLVNSGDLEHWQWLILAAIFADLPFLVAHRFKSKGLAASTPKGSKRAASPRGSRSNVLSFGVKKQRNRSTSPKRGRSPSPKKARSPSPRAASPKRGRFRGAMKRIFTRKNSSASGSA